MLFTWEINVPKNTTEASPVEQCLPIAHGIITWVSVLFPPGCAGLAHCQIYHFGQQIFPSRNGMDLSGDTFPIEWNEYYEMYHEPYDLKAKCWNEDDTYQHKLYFRVAVLPRRAVIATAVIDAIKGLFTIFTPKTLFRKDT